MAKKERHVSTVDIRADTEDVTKDLVGTVDLEEETEDVDKADDTIPDSDLDAKKKKSARRVRLPSKAEIMAAVDQQNTENLDVDEDTMRAAESTSADDS